MRSAAVMRNRSGSGAVGSTARTPSGATMRLSRMTSPAMAPLSAIPAACAFAPPATTTTSCCSVSPAAVRGADHGLLAKRNYGEILDRDRDAALDTERAAWGCDDGRRTLTRDAHRLCVGNGHR